MSVLNWTKAHGNQLPQMTCEIELDEKSACYSAEDVVSGKVLLNVSKAFYTYAIRVALEGCAAVKTEHGTTKSDVFLDIGANVFGKGERIACPAGQKTYEFSLKLTPTGGELPGSMKDSCGFISYQVVLYLKQELRSYKQAEKSITVRSYYCLSYQGDQGLLNPVVYQKLGKSPSMLQFMGIGRKGTSSPFGVVFRLKRSGFLQGEDIPFELEFKNLEGGQISLAKVALVQKTVYNAGNAPKVKRIDLHSVELKTLSANQTVWAGQLTVPPEKVCPTQTGIIDVSYSLKVEVTVPGQELHMLEAPIKIGTKQ